MRFVPVLVFMGILAAAGTARAAIDPNLIAATTPSVVTVNIKAESYEPPSLPDFGFAKPEGLRASGTGFVIDQAGGLIVTAEFVLEDAKEISVQTADGRSLPATVVGRDAMSGVAVLKVDDRSLPALKFCTSPPRVGEDAFLTGNPYQMGLLTVGGTVAGNDVAMKTSDMSPLMVVDLVMHKGVAGGPVVSLQGCVTGMAVAQFGSPAYGATGTLGMAIPGARVQSLSQELITTGRITRSWIGISLFDEDLTLSDVTPGGPADTAGLKTGDIIVSYDGVTATTFEALRSYIAARPIGAAIVLKISRRKEELSFTVPTMATPDDPSRP